MDWNRYEWITALFGWATVLGMLGGFVVSWFDAELATRIYALAGTAFMVAFRRDLVKLFRTGRMTSAPPPRRE